MTTIDERTAAREAALLAALDGQRRLASPEDYVFDKAQEKFWDLRDGTLHTDKAVDASIPLERWRVIVEEPRQEPDAAAAPRRGRPPGRPRERLVPPSRDILRVENDQFVEGSTWWPGRPQLIRDWFIDANGFRVAEGRRIYNQYTPPPEHPHGVPDRATPWVEHVKRLWPEPDEHEYFFDYCAHMVQRPHEKCNAAIVLSGAQGIGKDAALWPVKAAVGPWNCKGIDPDELFSPYRTWLQTLMLVVDEVRPSKDEFHASSMYNILKPMIVAPPDTLPLNEKYKALRYVINVLRVFITTNDWMAMYIPEEDRRMFIMHSRLPKDWHAAVHPDYFRNLFAFFAATGAADVAAWLRVRDLRDFDPKAESPRTSGWAAVANTWGEPEDAVGRALELLEKPSVLFSTEMLQVQFDGREEVAAMIKSPRKIGHRMQRAGYVTVRCPDAERWVVRTPSGDVLWRCRLAFAQAALAPDAAVAQLRERALRLGAARQRDNSSST
jgi:hypothetical protein